MISTPGVGSGLDINSIVSGLMNVERQPLEAVARQKTAYQTKLTAFGTIKSALGTFQTAVSALATTAKFNAQTATSASPSTFTAIANGNATSGSYSVTVNQLAKPQKIAMEGLTNVSDIVGTGTFTISFGTYTPAVVSPSSPASFVANANKPDINITIDSSNNTLSGVRDAINASNASVTASIVNDGTTNRLVISSKESGEVNGLKITVADADGNSSDATGLSRLAYDPLAAVGSGKNMTQVQPPLNALLEIDGIPIVKASNTITDAIDGVTLNLLTQNVGIPINLSVAVDQEKIKKSVTEFVDAYNKINDTLRNLTKYDSTGRSSGALLGDATTRSIITQLKTVLTQPVSTGGTITTLTDIGVSFQREGNLKIDDTKLTKAMTEKFSEIAALFANTAKTSDAQVTYVSSTSKTKAGTYAIDVSQIGSTTTNTIGTINGVTGLGSGFNLSGATGDASEGLRIRIGGSTLGARGTVTFTKGYASQLDSILSNILDTEGILTAKTDGINSSIKRLDLKTEELNYRLASIEKRYRAQFTRLDSVVSSLQSTSSFLTQQISALSANNNN